MFDPTPTLLYTPNMSELSSKTITAALNTHRLGQTVLYFPQISSTNDVVHAEAAAGAADGLLVVADEQTAGRGRLDRRWWAPPGSCLLMSLLLRPAIPLHRAGQLTMCLGLGAVEGIEALTGLRPALKWPNDLLLHDRKLGGMLTELRLDGDRLAYAAVGLGVNVNITFTASTFTSAMPSELTDTAISLLTARGAPVDRLALLAAILAHTEAWVDRLLAGASPHETWAARLDTLGRPVTVATAAGTRHGLAAGVTPEGALLVRDAEGHEHVVWSGDVTSLRPAT